MTHIATLSEPITALAKPLAGTSLTGRLRSLCMEAGAEHYVVVDLACDDPENESRIIACNWVFDAILAVGCAPVYRLLQGDAATCVGTALRGYAPEELVSPAGDLTMEQASALRDNGHGEFYCLKLYTGRARHAVMFSARRAGRIDRAAMARAQLMLSYELAEPSSGGAEAPPADNPLSDRERECLRWVSEGKTATEIAMILNVSKNTIASYVTHATRKLSAKNRSMAIAAAIRRGLI